MRTITKTTGSSTGTRGVRRTGVLANVAGTVGTLRRPGAVAIAALAAGPALGQIAGEQVVHGTAGFQRQGTLTTITASNNAIINYRSFNVGADEAVKFVQPDSLSRVLNRIDSPFPTRIEGSLSANGKVYFVNPSGVFFAKGAMINTAGLYAAAGTITNQDFLSGIDRFTTTPGGRVVNEGVIESPTIALVGRQVANFGTLRAPEGSVMMVSGDSVLIGEHFGHVYAKIDAPPAAGPEGGAGAAGAAAPRQGRFGAGDVFALAVWSTGAVKAQSAQLEAERGGVAVSGTIDVSDTSAGGRGGSVEVLGPAVALQGATIDASGDSAGGQVLIGGNTQGHGPERNALRTSVDSSSHVRADATGNGDGGKVVVWSNQATAFDGTISARGGDQGGDGGFVEVSSKGTLNADVTGVDLGAPKGSSGTLLLDPKFLQILGGTGDGSDDTDTSATTLINDKAGQSNTLGTITFSDNGAGGDGNSAGQPFIVRESEIEGTDANIVLQATDTITASGTFNNHVAGEPNGVVLLQNNRSLTIQVDGSNGNGSIDLTGSTHGAGLVFQTQGTGTISVLGRTGANTNSTPVTASSLVTAGGDITVGSNKGDVTLNGAINAGGGTVRVFAEAGAVSQGAGGGITAGALGARADGNVALSAGSNHVGTLAATTNGSGGATIVYADTGGFNVGTVNAVGSANAVGVDAGLANGVTLTVGSAGTATQTDHVIASKLTLQGSGTFNFDTSATNNVAQLQAGQSGAAVFAANYQDAGDVEIVNGTRAQTLNVRSLAGKISASGTIRIDGSMTLEADTIDLTTGTPAFTAGVSTSAVLEPVGVATNVRVNDAAAGGELLLLNTDLAPLSTFGNLTIGRANGTGEVSFGTVDPLSAFGQNLTLRSGGAGGKVTLRAGSTLATAASFGLSLTAGSTDAGVFTEASTATVTAGGNLTITADGVALGDTDSIVGTGVARLQPSTAGRAILLGGAADDGTKFSITGAEFGALKNGFSKIIVGAGTGSGPATIGALTVHDPLIVQTPGAAPGTLMSAAAITGSAQSGEGVALITGGDLSVNQITTTNAEITLSSGSAITLSNDLNAGTGTVRLVSGAGITQASGKVVAGSLGVRAAGAVDLTSATNNIDFLAANDSSLNASVKYRNVDGVAIGSVGAETLNAGTPVFTATTGVSTNKGDFTLVAGGGIDLGQDVLVDSSITGGTVRISGTGSVSQSGGRITANQLGVISQGTIDLTSATNQVGTAAINAGAAAAPSDVQLRTANGTTISTVTADGALFAGAAGITSGQGGDVLVNSGTGGLGVNQAINAGTGTVRLTSGAALFQAPGATISGSALGVRSTGDIVLQLANTPTTIAANTGGTGQFLYNLSAGSLAVGSVSAVPTLFTQTDGINAGTGAVRLVSPGQVAQTQPIIGSALGVRAGTGVTLTNASNNVGVLAVASTTGAVSYHDADALHVGSVATGGGGVFALTNGVTTVGNTSLQTGALTLDQPVNAGAAGDIRLVTTGGITQGAGADFTGNNLGVNNSGGGNVLLMQPGNSVSGFAASNDGGFVKLANTGALQVTAMGPDTNGFVQTNGITTGGGDATLESTGQVTFGSDVNAGAGVLRVVTGAGITQSASTAVTAGQFGFSAGGNVDVSQSGNSIGAVAGADTGAGSFVNVTTTSALNVGTVAFDPGGSFPTTIGLTTSSGAITLSAGPGLDVGAPINSGVADQLLIAAGLVSIADNLRAPGAAIRIQTSGLVTQSAGDIQANLLAVRAGGDVTIQAATNNVATFAATTGPSNGSVNYQDADALDIGSSGAAPGFATVDGVTTTTGGVVRLQTGGDLTQSDAIVSGSLGVRAAGAVTLNLVDISLVPVNDVGNFAATSTAAAAPITYRDSSGLAVGSVGSSGNFAPVAGVSTTGGGDILVHAGGPMTLSSAVNAGTGSVRLVAATDVTEDAGGSIVAGTLGVRAAGTITLGNAANNVTTFGAATGSGDVTYVDADGLTIGPVAASGTFIPGVTGVAASGAVVLQSGASGTGNLNFAPSTTVSGTAVTLRAGDGPAGAGATGTVDARTNSPTISNPGGTGGPAAFTLQQDATVDTNTSSLPVPTQYPNSAVPVAYRLQSDDGDIVANSGFFSPQTDLTLAVTPNMGHVVQVAPDLIVHSLTIIGAGSVQSVTQAALIEFQSDVTFDSTDTFLAGDEINFFGLVHAKNPGQTLTLRPNTPGLKINLGASGNNLDPNPGELDITALEISRIQREFKKVIFGEDPLTPALPPLGPLPPLTGTLEVVGAFTSVNPTVIGMKGVGSKILINAPITINGLTPGTAPLTITGTGATTTLGSDIVTNGQPIDIEDSVLVNGTRQLDTTGGGSAAAGANVTILGPTDGQADSANNTLNIGAGTGGNVTLTNAVGSGTVAGGRSLDALTATGAAISLPAVTTTGLQTYTGPTALHGNLTSTGSGDITLDGAVTLAASTIQIKTSGASGDDITLGGTVNGASALTLDAGAHGTGGTVNLTGDVGATTAVTSLSIVGDTDISGTTLTIKTAGAAGNNVSFGGDIDGATALTVNAGAGTTTLAGDVGSANTLTSFTVSGPAVLGTGLVTINTQNGVHFGSTVDSLSSVVGGASLTVAGGTGPVAIDGAAGATNALGAVSLIGSDVSIKGVRSNNAQSYTATGATTLGGDLTSLVSGAITVNGTWSASTGNITVRTAGGASDAITFTGASDAGAFGTVLTANAGAGAVTFGGGVGQTGSELASLTATGSTISLQDVRTSGVQSYTGATTLNGDLTSTTAAPITVNGDTTLVGAARAVTSAGGSINFLGKVDGASALTIDAGAGSVTMTGAVGATVPLASLAATGSVISADSPVTTAGSQTYTGSTHFGGNVSTQNAGAGLTVNGALDLGGPALAITTNNGPIHFTGAVGGSPALTLTAGTSTITADGSVGVPSALTSLKATASTITMSGAVSTTGDQSYFGVTTLGSDASAARLFFFGDTVLGNASGASTYIGAQGARFVGNVGLFGDSVINGGNGQIYFHGTVETAATAATNRSLTLISSHAPDLRFNTDPHPDPGNPNFIAFVDAPFLFNGNVGGGYGAVNVQTTPPTPAEAARMLKSLTFGDAPGVAPVATIIQTKGAFNVPGGSTPSSNINDWFVSPTDFSNASAVHMGSFTIPTPAQHKFDSGSDADTTRINTIGGMNMGVNNKFLSVGNMFVYADAGDFALGDLSSMANINVVIGEVERAGGANANGRRIVINSRATGTVASNQFSNDTQAGFTNVRTPDAGVDFVSLNNSNFSIFPEVSGGGTARFSAPTGHEDAAFTVRGVNQFPNGTTRAGSLERAVFTGADVDQNLLFAADGNAGANAKVFSALTQFGLGLDLRAEGVPESSLASALAGALPSSDAGRQVQQGVSLGANVLEDLLQLGLEVKDTNAPGARDQVVSGLSGRTEYNDIPPYARPDPARKDYRVSVNRLSADSVHSVLNAYYDLVGADPAERPDRKAQVKAAIEASWSAYLDSIGDKEPDGIGFRRFVEGKDSEKQTLTYLDKIGVLLERLNRLALSPVERQGPKLKVLSDFKADAMNTTEPLEAAATGEPVTAPSVTLAPSPGPVAQGGGQR